MSLYQRAGSNELWKCGCKGQDGKATQLIWVSNITLNIEMPIHIELEPKDHLLRARQASSTFAGFLFGALGIADLAPHQKFSGCQFWLMDLLPFWSWILKSVVLSQLSWFLMDPNRSLKL